jgi:hypothetical protein
MGCGSSKMAQGPNTIPPTQNIGTQNVPVQTQRQPLSKKQKAAEAGKNLGFVSMLAS